MTNPHLTLPSDADLERMLSATMGTISEKGRRKTRKHRIAAIALAGIVAIGCTAGGLAIARASQGAINYTAECYGAADTNSTHFTSFYLPGDITTRSATPLAERISLAKEQCAASWRIGTFEKDRSSIPEGKTFTVPDLVACQLPDDRLGIFPSSKPPAEACSALELATPRS
jgi:hypothetical protein